jgi:formylglycine-generating enzyme required for sulfatase activity
MRWKILTSIIVIIVSANFTLAKCPSADLNGDCFVDFEDFALMAAQWPNVYDWNDVNTLAAQWLTTDPCVSDDMAYMPDGEFEMGDHHGDNIRYDLPVHAVYLDSFFMSKYEITNQQYCDYLNSAEDANEIKVDGGIVYASSDDSNSYPYCVTSRSNSNSQIDYNDVFATFSVRTKPAVGGRDMSDDPMVMVSWYGAAAYCNWRSQQEGYQSLYDLSDPNWPCDFSKHGYRLPTEAEWEYAARGGEHSPYYRFPWGDTISHSQANYRSSAEYPYDVSPTGSYHPDWDDGISPITAPVGIFSANGYGLYDMTGNVWEWCNDWWSETYYSESPYDNPTGPATGTCLVIRGGSWLNDALGCRVAAHVYGGIDGFYGPGVRFNCVGFRLVLDLN